MKKQVIIEETRSAFEELEKYGWVTTKRISLFFNITERNARKRLKNAGFVRPEGTCGVWIREGKRP